MTPRFTEGDEVVNGSGETLTVVLADPDRVGTVVVADGLGRYRNYAQGVLEPKPTRYVVELRHPKAGERYLSGSAVYTADADSCIALPVVVG